MKKENISIKYLKEYNVGIAIYKGDINIKDLKKAFNDIYTSSNIQNAEILISDFSEANFKFQPKDVSELVNTDSKYSFNNPLIKSILISKQPKETGICFLFVSKAKIHFPEMKLFIFSDIEELYEKIELKIPQSKLEKEISKLF